MITMTHDEHLWHLENVKRIAELEAERDEMTRIAVNAAISTLSLRLEIIDLQAEIDALRARVAELERIRCPDGNRHIWDYGYCKKCRQHAADLIDAALAAKEGE